MDRIADTFARAREENRGAFIAYVCAGDPDFETSVAACRALLENGVDVLELGVPFSDPLADGLTNQLAAQRALESGMTQDRLFELVRRVREFSQAPIVFYAYYNMLFAPGLDVSLRRCREAGVDGLLTLDCPPEEAGDLLAASRANGVQNIFLIAPTTPPARMARIARDAKGFIYYVSREGVTGERRDVAGNLASQVAEIRKHTSLPVVVGFGVSAAEHVRAICAVSDGVVVGSALVNTIASRLERRAEIPGALAEKMRELRTGLKR